MGTFDEVDAPYHLRRAIYDHQIHAKNSITLEEDEIELNEMKMVHLNLVVQCHLLEKIIFVNIIPTFWS